MTPAQASLQSFIGAWHVMASHFPHAILGQANGLATCVANIPLFFFNAFFYDQPIESIEQFDQVLQDINAEGARLEHGWLSAVCHELTVEDWQSRLAPNSLISMMDLTGMTTPALKPPTRELPELEWRAIHSEKEAADCALINAISYHMPPEGFDSLANMYLWTGSSYGLVGYLNGQPITTAAAFPVGNTIYIALVATHPDHRGKGYAEACIRKVVEAARPIMASESIDLHASEAGRPLYQTMGFEPVARFTIVTRG